MKKTQIERAIDALQKQKEDLMAKFNAEAGGIEAAITALRQQRKPKKPRAVPAVEKVG